jgi:anti-sigma regulatory factor (Ser/Thr protein kinase)
MKIKQNAVENVSIGEQGESYFAGIDPANYSKVFMMISESLYTNPIGSFIREIVSNAIDANTTAKVDKPVLINVFKEDLLTYITVEDEGVGMSDEEMKTVYMSIFKSTKDDNDDHIGGWGLGSKSPLAYASEFEINTCKDGILNRYLLVKNEGLELIPLETAISEKSGTTIKIEIKENDIYTVHKELNKQLIYFKNVVVYNNFYYYENEYNILDFNDFYYTEKANQYFNNSHICLKGVYYPLDFNILEIQDTFLQKIPIAIKFEVSEIEVTTSRENINYTKNTIANIKQKYLKINDYMYEKYKKSLIITNINDVLDNFLNNTLKANIFNFYENISFTVADNFKSKNLYFKHLKINNNVIDSLFFRIYKTFFTDKTRKNKLDRVDFQKVFSKKYLLFKNTARESVIDILIGQSYYMFEKRTFKECKDKLLYTLLPEDTCYKNGKYLYTKEDLKVAFDFYKTITNFLDAKLKDYKTYISQEDIEAYKEEQKEIQEFRKGTITFYNDYNRRTTESVDYLLNRYQMIFYIVDGVKTEVIINEDNTTDIKHFHYEDFNRLLYYIPNYIKEKILIINIKPSTFTKIKNKKQFVPVEYIFKIKKLKNYFVRSYLYNEQNTFLEHTIRRTNLTTYSKYYENISKLWYKKTRFSSLPFSVLSTFEYYITLVRETNTKVFEFEIYFNELKEVYEKNPLLETYLSKISFCEISDKDKSFILSKLKMLKLNKKYYKFK